MSSQARNEHRLITRLFIPLLGGSEVSSAARDAGTDAWKGEQRRAVIMSTAPGARVDLTLRFATY